MARATGEDNFYVQGSLVPPLEQASGGSSTRPTPDTTSYVGGQPLTWGSLILEPQTAIWNGNEDACRSPELQGLFDNFLETTLAPSGRSNTRNLLVPNLKVRLAR